MTSVLWESITTLQTPQESRSSYYSRDLPRGASLFDTEEIVAFDTFCSYEDGDANKETTIIDNKVQWNSGITASKTDTKKPVNLLIKILH